MARISKKDQLRDIIRRFQAQTGKTEFEAKEIAKFALSLGVELPRQKTQIEILAEKIAAAAREETRKDRKTGRPYRAYQCYRASTGKGAIQLWLDIDHAPRDKMHKALIMRREQMVGDGLQLYLDVEHWNNVNPEEKKIIVPLDFTEDIEEKIAAMERKSAA